MPYYKLKEKQVDWNFPNAFGVFVYDLFTDENMEGLNEYFNDMKEAIEYAKDMVKDLNKDKKITYVGVWQADDDGYYGIKEVPIWASKESGFYKDALYKETRIRRNYNKLIMEQGLNDDAFDMIVDLSENDIIPIKILELVDNILSKRIKPTEKGLDIFKKEIQAFNNAKIINLIKRDIYYIKSGDAKKYYKNLYGEGVSATSELFDQFIQAVTYGG